MDFAANTNVIGHAGKTLAIVEAGGRPIELSYELDTLRRGDFDGTLPERVHRASEARPADRRAARGLLLVGLGNQVQYIVVDTAGKVTKVVPIETTGAPMLHDMGLSERYVVVLDLPCVFDLELATAGRFPYNWDRVVSGPRRRAAARRRQRRRAVVRDRPLLRVPSDERVRRRRSRRVRRGATPEDVRDRAQRPERGSADARPVDVRPLERQGRRGASRTIVGRSSRATTSGSSASRTATATRSPPDPGLVLAWGSDQARPPHGHDGETHDFGAGTQPAEPVFVPASDDAAEDDGYVMTFVYDEKTDRSDLVILHAQDFAGDPVASVHLPQRVPYGFHGNWVPDPDDRLTELGARGAASSLWRANGVRACGRSRSPRRASGGPTRSMRTTGSSSWRRARLQLDEVVDDETVVAEEADPLAVGEHEVDRLAVGDPLHAERSRGATSSSAATRRRGT